MSKKNTDLFEAFALLSVPLERSFHLALDLIKDDNDISDKYRDDLKTSIKALLSNSLEFHEYLRKKDPNLDFYRDGKDRYSELRNKFKTSFPSSHDKEFNLHELIDKGTDKRVEESLRSKKAKD